MCDHECCDRSADSLRKLDDRSVERNEKAGLVLGNDIDRGIELQSDKPANEHPDHDERDIDECALSGHKDQKSDHKLDRDPEKKRFSESDLVAEYSADIIS